MDENASMDNTSIHIFTHIIIRDHIKRALKSKISYLVQRLIN